VPTYEYRCDNCGENFDVVQSFHDAPLTECPTCGSAVKKVFGSVGIVFKGSGFYKTDSRSTGSPSRPSESTPATTPAGASGDGGTSPGSASTGSSGSSDPTPAAKPAAASTGDKSTSTATKD
jgi:putative FmdB family regulatory protein